MVSPEEEGIRVSFLPDKWSIFKEGMSKVGFLLDKLSIFKEGINKVGFLLKRKRLRFVFSWINDSYLLGGSE